jgi:hypothetical protein
LIRDLFHLLVNLSMSTLSEKENLAVAAMRSYFIEELRPYLDGDPQWEKVKRYVEGKHDDD